MVAIFSTFARNVRPGDKVTEAAASHPSQMPNGVFGPWYEVVSNDDDVLVIKTDDDLEVKIPYHAGQHVLVRR